LHVLGNSLSFIQHNLPKVLKAKGNEIYIKPKGGTGWLQESIQK